MICKDQLNVGQKNALSYIHDFLSGVEHRQMILIGAAGTGKTSLLNVLLDELDNQAEYEYVATAPTNEAVRVISTNTGRDFSKTIYSLLGLVLIQDDDTKPRLERSGDCHVNDYDIIIIDEASMISREIYKQINEVLVEYTRIKIIYIGDSAQLPPVDDSNSGLKESIVFSIENKIELTEVMRTSEQNPILGIVTTIRQNLQSKYDLFERKTVLGDDGMGVHFYDYKKEWLTDVVKCFTSESYKKNKNYCRVIAYTNLAVEKMNIFLRKQMFGNDVDDFIENDDLIVTEPYTINVPNRKSRSQQIIYTVGERLKIISAKRVMNEKYAFFVWELTVLNYEADINKQMMRKCYVLCKESIDSYYHTREILANKAKRLLMHREESKRIYSKKEAWREYFELKSAFLSVTYSYSMTTHRSQGSTVENIFVVERDLNILTWDDELRNKLKYVAFSRAAKQLNILH